MKVADGDTVTILDKHGHKQRIRLAGIDAPEKNQPYGQASTRHMKALVHGKQVTIEYRRRDRYGRIVGKIFVDSDRTVDCLSARCVNETDVGLVQIKAGLAWHYKKYQHEQNVEDRRKYAHANRAAQEQRVGLWKEEDRMPPWEWRKK